MSPTSQQQESTKMLPPLDPALKTSSKRPMGLQREHSVRIAHHPTEIIRHPRNASEFTAATTGTGLSTFRSSSGLSIEGGSALMKIISPTGSIYDIPDPTELETEGQRKSWSLSTSFNLLANGLDWVARHALTRLTVVSEIPVVTTREQCQSASEVEPGGGSMESHDLLLTGKNPDEERRKDGFLRRLWKRITGRAIIDFDDRAATEYKFDELTEKEVNDLPWKKFLRPFSLHFRSARMEEMYQRHIILPSRIVHHRVMSRVMVINNMGIFYSLPVVSLQPFPICGEYVEKGEFLCENVSIFPIVTTAHAGHGGLSATFLERLAALLLVLLITSVKAAIIWIGEHDVMFAGDRDRRIRYIKTKLVEKRLSGMQEENQKTEYLLSLTLPSTIVTKLKEVGTDNFDLIAQRVKSASIMFTDLKNYKEISESLGSKKDAVLLLNTIFHHMDQVRASYSGVERIKTINSKMLLLGGLTDRDHLTQMIDMAIALRDGFNSKIGFDVSNEGETKQIPIKLDIGFGIQCGPLVTGIVGKKTFCYEVYGDVVNTASRMLSIASGAQIVVTSQVRDEIYHAFETTSLGERNVKGKGLVTVYSVTSRRAAMSFDELFNDGTVSGASRTPSDPLQAKSIGTDADINQQTRSPARTRKPSAALSDTTPTTPMLLSSTAATNAMMEHAATAIGVSSETLMDVRKSTELEGPPKVIPLQRFKQSVDTLMGAMRAQQEYQNAVQGRVSRGTGDMGSTGSLSKGKGAATPSGYRPKRRASHATIYSKRMSVVSASAQSYSSGERKESFGGVKRDPAALGSGSIESLSALADAINLAKSMTSPSTPFKHFGKQQSVGPISQAKLTTLGDKEFLRHTLSLRNKVFKNNVLQKIGTAPTSLASLQTDFGSTSLNQSADVMDIPEMSDNFKHHSISFTQPTIKRKLTAKGSPGLPNLPEMPSTLHLSDKPAHSTIDESNLQASISENSDAIPDPFSSVNYLGSKRPSDLSTLSQSETQNTTQRPSIIKTVSVAPFSSLAQKLPNPENDKEVLRDDILSERLEKIRRETVIDMDLDDGVTSDGLKVDTKPRTSLYGRPSPAASKMDREHSWSATQDAQRSKSTLKSTTNKRPPTAKVEEDSKESTDSDRIAKYLLAAIAAQATISPADEKNNKGVTIISADSHLDVINKSLTPSLQFTSIDLENRFRQEYNAQTWTIFIYSCLKGICSQLLLLILALINLYLVVGSSLPDEHADYYVIFTAFFATGSQLILTGMNGFESAAGEESPSPIYRTVYAILSALSFIIIVVLVSFPWSGLLTYFLLIPLILPQHVVIYIFMVDGLGFSTKFTFAIATAVGIGIINSCVSFSMWLIPFTPVLTTILWALIFSNRERSLRVEYMMDLILKTQADLVAQEIAKSSRVLNSILPTRIIVKLLADPTSIFYEEFETTTVLHMDIAGFTAMSSDLEPILILKMLNTLFTYFDRLTEDFHVEKITTIGDAYVACSSLTTGADPKISAISVCIVAIQMQQFVETQLNTSYFMKSRLKKTISMRIGCHTGPAYGAIMGGSKNFRYDLMGDTVIIAEKYQEKCLPDGVCISEATRLLVKDYHGFEMIPTDIVILGMPGYQLIGNRGLLMRA
ncbi:hypothetical protein HDU76_006134 [Blyttiomyces sp. JEL0837]|nr:hypothetical protein HDU76_006134 [Blyttiomyces sp. JEL0837]